MRSKYVQMEAERSVRIVLTNPIPPPLKEVNMTNIGLIRFMNRNVRTTPSIDELYHESSKWTPRTINLEHVRLFNDHMGSFQSPEVIYQYVVDGEKGLYRNLGSMPEVVQILFQELKKRTSPRLNYYILIQADGEDVYSLFCFTRSYEDMPDYFILKRTLTSSEIEQLLSNVWTLGAKTGPVPPGIKAIVFIVGNLATSQVIFGLRAYRHLLIESGYAACVVQSLVEKLSETPPLITSFFHDNALNDLLDIDGVEFAILNVVLIGRRKNQRQVMKKKKKKKNSPT